jgi:predicted MPP superfamily phosphohydrolase
MDSLLALIYKVTGSVYIPKELQSQNEGLIIHISDTPVCFFSPLQTLLRKLKPDYIIHTGDLVDNLKLQFSKTLLPRYERNLKLLMNIMESSTAKDIYIVPGNHDRVAAIKSLSTRSIIKEASSNINIEGINIRISHYSQDILSDPQEVNLFGHDLSLCSGNDNSKIFLNGITSINLITIKDKQVFKLLYPFGTDDMRLKRGKIGL